MKFVINVYLYDPNNLKTSHLQTQFLDGSTLENFKVGKMFRIDKEEWAYKIVKSEVEPLNANGELPVNITVTD